MNDEKFLPMIEAMYGGDAALPKKLLDYDDCSNKGQVLIFKNMLISARRRCSHTKSKFLD
jgi:hypothetical protein